jgi:putative Mg2+ transporter-C (MgtC) family protein
MELTFNPSLSPGAQLELGLRLILGLGLGAIIGFERELHRQPAGFRTHSLVCLGAALFAIISGYGYSGASIDPTRITAQIVSGIGFIGAGTILQHRGQVRGLTTAASLWAVAAIGTASGSGLYTLAILGTILILVVLSLLDRIESYAHQHMRGAMEAEEVTTASVRSPSRGPNDDESHAHHDPTEGKLEDMS